jgi:hypothetical protein
MIHGTRPSPRHRSPLDARGRKRLVPRHAPAPVRLQATHVSACTASKLGAGSVSRDLAWRARPGPAAQAPPGLREAPHVSDYAARARLGKADCLLWPTIRLRLNPSPPLRGRTRCLLGRPADDKSAASSSSVEENTRTCWSGVKITSVSAITSPAQPQPRRHEDHLRQAEADEAEPDPRPQDRTVTS